MTIRTAITNGFIKENPVFIMLLGMCPTLGVTNTAINGLAMGLATTFTMVGSSTVVSSVRNLIPERVRIPSYIVIIASFVTLIDIVLAGFAPAIHETLGIFVPLIVVNCLILGRAESTASSSTVGVSLLDAITMGLGFTWALTLLGLVREVLGSGAVFGYTILPESLNILIFVTPPGAFLALGFLIPAVNSAVRWVERKRESQTAMQPAQTFSSSSIGR